METTIFLSIIITVFVFCFLYVFISFQNENDFIESRVEIINFNNKINEYKGFVIIADKSMYIEELNLFRNLKKNLSRREKCYLINLTLDKNTMEKEMEIIQKLKLKTLPAILYSNNQIQELTNFGEFPNNLSEKNLIKNITEVCLRKELL